MNITHIIHVGIEKSHKKFNDRVHPSWATSPNLSTWLDHSFFSVKMKYIKYIDDHVAISIARKFSPVHKSYLKTT